MSFKPEDRVVHNVFRPFPVFNDGPVGRMQYFGKIMLMYGVMIALLGGMLVLGPGVEGPNPNTVAVIGQVVFGTALFGAVLVFIFHGFALAYKRIWDIGVTDSGARVGWTIGAAIAGVIPVVGFVVALVLLFYPPSRKEAAAPAEA